MRLAYLINHAAGCSKKNQYRTAGSTKQVHHEMLYTGCSNLLGKMAVLCTVHRHL